MRHDPETPPWRRAPRPKPWYRRIPWVRLICSAFFAYLAGYLVADYPHYALAASAIGGAFIWDICTG